MRGTRTLATTLRIAIAAPVAFAMALATGAPAIADEATPAAGGAIVAQADVVASGTCGECAWSIDSEGALSIGEGALASNNNGAGDFWPWYGQNANIKSVKLSDKTVLSGSLAHMFSDCSNLASVDASGWDTSNATSMSNMFNYCSSLTSVDVSKWDVSGVTDMQSMFGGCVKLASLDLSGWDTSKVTDMSYLFYRCTSLPSLGVSGWDTSKVEDMGFMFSRCSALASLDLSGWDTSKVTDMIGMFETDTVNGSSLASLDLSGWDTSKVTDMGGMFSGCSALASLDLSGWDTSKVTGMGGMFDGCSSLASIKVGSAYSINDSNMFPDATASNGRWFSDTEKAWYTKDQIVSDRSGVADTYATTCPAGYETPLSEATVGLSETSLTYDGTAKRPAVTAVYGKTTLAEGTDYTVSYSDNVNAGTATATVTGTGCWSGSVERTFTIEKASLSGASVYAAGQTYTGSALEPAPTVKINGNALAEGTDYTVSYSDNVNAGTATATVTGRGSCTGTKTATFTIAKAANAMTARAAKAKVTATYNASKAVATASNVAVSGAQGKVAYANASSDATAKKFKVNATAGKVTIPRRTKAGTYAVVVRVTAAGNANYKAASETVSYKVVVAKAVNPLTVKAVKRTAKLATVRKKAVTVARPFKVTKKQGTLSFKKAGGSKRLTVNSKTGKVTVRKGAKRGAYKVKIKVTAKGNANYKKATKTLTCKVVVK